MGSDFAWVVGPSLRRTRTGRGRARVSEGRGYTRIHVGREKPVAQRKLPSGYSVSGRANTDFHVHTCVMISPSARRSRVFPEISSPLFSVSVRTRVVSIAQLCISPDPHSSPHSSSSFRRQTNTRCTTAVPFGPTPRASNAC